MVGSEPAPVLQRVRAAAEGLLVNYLNAPARLGEPARLGGTRDRSTVVRCVVVEGPAAAPPFVVVKHYYGDVAPRPADEEPWTPELRLLNEWAGLRFLNALPDTAPGPRLYGGDRQAAVLVMEDLGDGPCLADLLQGDDQAAAITACEQYAAGLGRLHAATAGRVDAYREQREALGAPILPHEQAGALLARELPAFIEGSRQVDVEPTDATRAEALTIAAMMDEPGMWAAFSPGDTCPDNHRLLSGQPRFFDLEFGGMRHALLDASYLWVPFPTCWCVNRLPIDLVPRLETIYQTELARTCPPAGDDAAFNRALVAACAYWTIVTLGWDLTKSLAEDFQWGIAGIRPRHLLRLETLAQLSDRTGHFPAIGATAHALGERLRERWPDVVMPLYPPFR